MSLLINNRIWELAEKLYIHCYEVDGLVNLLRSQEINLPEDFYSTFEVYSYMSTTQTRFAQFMQRVPAYRYLPLLERIIFDDDGRVANTARDNWNYYGVYIRGWYPEIIRLLTEIDGVEVNTIERQISYQDVQIERNQDNPDFLEYNFNDPFLDYIKKEINESHNSGHYLAVMILSRKLIECLILRVFEIVFRKMDENGTYNGTNHALWFDTTRNRILDLEILLENLKNNAANFHEDKDFVEEICTLIRPLKNEMNKVVHRDYKVPQLEDVTKWDIPGIFNKLGKLYRKYCNP